MSSNPSDTTTTSTSTSTSTSTTSSSTHAPSTSISATSTNINAPTTTTTASNVSMSASSSQATLPLPTRTPSPSPSPSPSPLTTTTTATAATAATSEEVLSLRSLKEQQREKERRRDRDRGHKHRHRSRDERKEDETDEERRARRERRENETPEQRAARRAERAARRAAREQRKHHSVIMHPRTGGGGGNANDMELMPMGASSEHKSAAPLSPISPASSDDETSPHDTGDNTTADITSSMDEKVLERPLIYYKRSNPVRQRTVKEEGPVQIVFPGNVMCLGESPLKPSREVSQEHDHLVVFSSPNDDQMSRTKVFACLLIFLLPADFILVSTIYFQGSIVDDTSGSQNVTDALTYACTVMALFLGFVGMRLKDTRVLTIFIVVFYIDAVLNLIRIYTILQFSHFIIQLAIGHVMTQYKQTLTGSWFAPVN